MARLLLSLLSSFALGVALAQSNLALLSPTDNHISNISATSTSTIYSTIKTAHLRDIWIATWQSPDSLGGTIGNGTADFSAIYSRSTDNGRTWSANLAVAPWASTQSDGGRQSSVAGIEPNEENQVLVIVWDSRYNYNDTAGADYDIYSVRSLNLGVTWEAPVPVNLAYTDSGRDDSPVIASNLVDLFIVVWASQDTLGNQLGTDYDVLLSRSIDYGQSWSSPVPVNSEAGDSSKNFVDLSPTVSFLSQYRIIVAWEYWQANSFVNYEIRARVSLNYGYSWRNELTIGESGSNGERSAFSPAVFGDPDTLLQTMIVWSILSPPLAAGDQVVFSKSDDGGSTWSTPAHPYPSSLTYDNNRPSVGFVNGEWFVVWSSNDPHGTFSAEHNILMTTSTDFGVTWSNVTFVNNATTDGSDGPMTSPTISCERYRGDSCLITWKNIDVYEKNYALSSAIGQKSCFPAGDFIDVCAEPPPAPTATPSPMAAATPSGPSTSPSSDDATPTPPLSSTTPPPSSTPSTEPETPTSGNNSPSSPVTPSSPNEPPTTPTYEEASSNERLVAYAQLIAFALASLLV